MENDEHQYISPRRIAENYSFVKNRIVGYRKVDTMTALRPLIRMLLDYFSNINDDPFEVEKLFYCINPDGYETERDDWWARTFKLNFLQELDTFFKDKVIWEEQYDVFVMETISQTLEAYITYTTRQELRDRRKELGVLV